MTRRADNQVQGHGFNSYHVGIAAEAFTAGLIAHAGYEVLVQYGANQPLYDLIAVKRERILKVSVKGSNDGGWGLTQSLLRNADYQGAADLWLTKHQAETVFFFLQFDGVEPGAIPRAYVARAREVAKYLKAVHLGRGDTRFDEKHTYVRGTAKGHTDQIPAHWRFSRQRIDSV